MSAPHTDPEKQKKQHRAPLLGLRSVVFWALVLLALFTILVTVRGNQPGDEEANPDTTDVPAPAEEIAE